MKPLFPSALVEISLSLSCFLLYGPRWDLLISLGYYVSWFQISDFMKKPGWLGQSQQPLHNDPWRFLQNEVQCDWVKRNRRVAQRYPWFLGNLHFLFLVRREIEEPEPFWEILKALVSCRGFFCIKSHCARPCAPFVEAPEGSLFFGWACRCGKAGSNHIRSFPAQCWATLSLCLTFVGQWCRQFGTVHVSQISWSRTSCSALRQVF